MSPATSARGAPGRWGPRPVGVLGALALLSACAVPVPAPPPRGVAEAPPVRPPLEAGERVYLVSGPRSRIRVRVSRGGRLARLGHDHLVTVRGLEGEVRWRPGVGGRAWLRLPVARLEVDDPRARAAAGLGPPLPDGAVSGTRENMLGPRVLDAARHPWVTLQAQTLALVAGRARVRLKIRLHGVGRSFELPVVVEEGPGTLTATGTLALRQSDFGITPYSVLGGALQVVDRLQIDFRLVAEAPGPGPEQGPEGAARL